jgi:hypothetical protein
MARITRFSFALILGILLLASPAWAGSPRTRQPKPDVFTQIWSLLTGLLGIDEGCIIDPHGCSPKPAPTVVPQTDAGCIIDPHGCSPQG